MKQQATVDLFLYWNSVRQGGDGSEQATVAPQQLRALLAGTFLVEADTQRAYPLRVIGSGVEPFAANARVGGPFLEWWDIESQPDLESALFTVHDEDTPVVMGVASLADSQWRARAEILLLPLATSPNGKACVLGGLAPVSTTGRLLEPGRLAIVSFRILHPPLIAPPRPSHPARRAGDRPRLRVIEGGLLAEHTSLSRI